MNPLPAAVWSKPHLPKLFAGSYLNVFFSVSSSGLNWKRKMSGGTFVMLARYPVLRSNVPPYPT